MSNEATEFELDGTRFLVEPLKVKAQMRGWAIVGGVILPIFMSGGTLDADAIKGALQAMDRVSELFDMFAEATKVSWGPDAKMVPLKTFADNVFARRSDLNIGFLTECIFSEYGSFLDERGKSVLSKVGDRFGSLLA